MEHDKSFIYWFILVIIVGGCLALTLGGCVTTGSTQSLAPVCEALGSPHRYNSKKLASKLHAGPDLVKRLIRDNRVGLGLACKGY